VGQTEGFVVGLVKSLAEKFLTTFCHRQRSWAQWEKACVYGELDLLAFSSVPLWSASEIIRKSASIIEAERCTMLLVAGPDAGRISGGYCDAAANRFKKGEGPAYGGAHQAEGIAATVLRKI